MSGADELAALRAGLAAGARDFVELCVPRADLRGLRLAGCDLSGATLRGCRLDGVDLAGARLVEADLRGASLRGARLVRADLRGADLRLCDLVDADLTRADLCEADLRGADFTGAQLEGTAVSLGCKSFDQVTVGGGALLQILGLLDLLRTDDHELRRQLGELCQRLGCRIADGQRELP